MLIIAPKFGVRPLDPPPPARCKPFRTARARFRCADITKLYLQENSFHGSLPHFENLASATEIRLDQQDPGFAGTLPSSIG